MKGRRLPLGGAARRDKAAAAAAEAGGGKSTAAAAAKQAKAPPASSSSASERAISRPQRLASSKPTSSAAAGATKVKSRSPRSLPPTQSKPAPSPPAAKGGGSSPGSDDSPQDAEAKLHQDSNTNTAGEGPSKTSAAGAFNNTAAAAATPRPVPQKRMSDLSDRSASAAARTKCYEVLPTLDAVGADGRHTTVRVMIDGVHYAPVRDVTERRRGSSLLDRKHQMMIIHDSSAVGQDGNRFHCQVCKGFGQIVCCDGCPRVYHPECIPLEDPSRVSLDQDDDPWYCPECIAGTKTGTPSPPGGKKSGATKKGKKASASAIAPSRLRSTSQQRCVDCQMNRTDLALEPCEACGNHVHHPSCRDDTDSADAVYCSTCRAVDGLTMEEDESAAVAAHTLKRVEADAEFEDDDDDDDDDDNEDDDGDGAEGEGEGDDQMVVEAAGSQDSVTSPLADATANGAATPPTTSSSRRKRKRRLQGSGDTKDGTNGSDQKLKRKKKKNKKQRKSRDSAGAAARRSPSPMRPPSPVPNSAAAELLRQQREKQAQDELAAYPSRNAAGMAVATPAFYFYLGENRWKLERALARNHRYFNRLPKGPERNALVAGEAAQWWSKLRPADHRRYMNMSMRDFESRIIEWKEDKNLAELGLLPGNETSTPPEEKAACHDDSTDDDRLTYERHERLYLNTSVGSKPFKQEPDQSYNRVLLDLLHDMRFHPLPMFNVNRSGAETVIDDHNAKVTIPHFEVHGPISTSVGDECLGCSRGWLHFCHVLQRRVPAVEHRAKLQPPVSSWVGTRVGLGLRPRLEKIDESAEEEGKGSKAPDIFSWRSSEEMEEIKKLPVLPSSTLSQPSDRADDIANFIEETMVMKVPEPPRPLPPAVNNKSGSGSAGRKLPIAKPKENGVVEDDQEGTVYKCGRCRTIIYNDTGCVQCRRAQLVINTTKRAPANPEKSGNLKIRTVMLGRVQFKDGLTEMQSESDVAVSNAMLKERWTPSAILPPHGSDAPGAEVLGPDVEDEDEVSDPMEVEEEQNAKVEEEEEGAAETSPEEEAGLDKDKDTDSGRARRQPQRSSRMVSGATTSGELVTLDRDNIAKDNKKKAAELHRKTLSIATCGILLALKRRDPLLLFAEPATAEGYSAVVKNPIDLGKIRAEVLAEKYSSLGAFVSEARLLCENALAFNPVGSIYSKTAKELYDLLVVMQKRASNWMGAIMDAYNSFLFNEEQRRRKVESEGNLEAASDEDADPFESLRAKWPQAVDMLENGDWLKKQIESDFMRTQENESAYYGSMAVRRVAAAAEASLAPYTDAGGAHSVVSRRTDVEDEALRRLIDERVCDLLLPLQLKDVSTWREESVVRLLRKVQSRRLDRRSASENGCSRCDSIESIRTSMKALNVEFAHPGRTKRKGEGDVPRVDSSRMYLTTGLGSAKTCGKIVEREKQKQDQVDAETTLQEVCVSVRGSKIHGWGMFADQPFKKGDIVAEYLGEYVANPVADAREKVYQQQRIQDYQFRLDDKLVIDATMKGGFGRYINHNCSPNCYAKIVPGKEPKPHLKRVLIIAQRAIGINEEITYDYQFPLELNLANRIPCNCQSEACRGFMNWDIPEKGSTRALLVQKRGANMRDRIRRLGRPLKRDADAEE